MSARLLRKVPGNDGIDSVVGTPPTQQTTASDSCAAHGIAEARGGSEQGDIVETELKNRTDRGSASTTMYGPMWLRRSTGPDSLKGIPPRITLLDADLGRVRG